MIEEEALATKAVERLESFHARRLAKLDAIKLTGLLKKNPYLYRAIGHVAASDYVRAALDAFVSSSDETIFGNEFFEPLAQWAAEQAHREQSEVTVQAGGGAGFDISIETPTEYKAIAVKSGTNIFNSQSGKQQVAELDALQARIRKAKKVFHPIIGYGYGRKRQRDANLKVLKLAGQAFGHISLAKKSSTSASRPLWATSRCNLRWNLKRPTSKPEIGWKRPSWMSTWIREGALIGQA
jgi:hypothetical protein